MPTLELLVNGVRRTVEADAGQSLLSVLRDELDLTGTKYGCGEGQCGACTVLVAGKPVRSCLTKAETVGAAAVTTVEGLAENGRLHPVQQSFLDHGAMQCGFCIPGMIVEAVALLARRAGPSQAEVAQALQGHLCRCCAYTRIVRAVHGAAGAKAERR